MYLCVCACMSYLWKIFVGKMAVSKYFNMHILRPRNFSYINTFIKPKYLTPQPYSNSQNYFQTMLYIFLCVLNQISNQASHVALNIRIFNLET